jgi:hypothetical protein
MEGYFTRKINEGTVSRTHTLSTSTEDGRIILTMTVQKGGKVLDNLLIKSVKKNDKSNYEIDDNAKQTFIVSLKGLRINGLPILYEDLGENFTSDELIEIMGFVNGMDMSIFGGKEGEITPNV